MKNLEIYIDGTRLNFIDREGFPLSLSLSIDAAENPSRIVGSYSKRTINFPGDGETGEFFQEWADSTRINPDAASRRPCRIDVDGITVFTGVAQLEDVTATAAHGLRRVSGHRVSIVGNNATWFSDFQNMRIKDMGLMDVHELNSVDVGANDNADPDADTWGYFLAKKQDWSQPENVRYFEFTPFLFIRSILTEAFRSVGYVFQSDFFDTHLGKRLILPVPFRELSSDFVSFYETALRDDLNTIVDLGGGLYHYKLQGNEVNKDLNDNYDESAGEYTAPFSGLYLVETCVLYDYPPGPANFGIQINGVTQSPIFGNILINRFGWVYQNTYFLNQGDTVRLVFNLDYITNGCHLVIVPTFAFEEGTTISLSHYGNPDWVVSDLVLGLTHAFGLVWDTDYDGQKIRVEPRDRYKLTYRDSAGDAVTEYHDGFYLSADRDTRGDDIDLAKDATVSNVTDLQEEYRLAWKSDSNDPNMSEQDDKADLKTFDAVFNFPSGRFRTGRQDFENRFFSKSLHYFDIEVRHDDSTMTPQLPLLRKEKVGTEDTTQVTDFAPRILYFAGRREGLDGLVNLEDFGIYDPPTAFMVNYNDPTGADPCLSFGSETLLNGTVVPGLMQIFHLQHLKRLEFGKSVEEFMRWTEAEIINLSFRKKILIGDALFLLQKLDGYKPTSTGSIKTLLLADAVPEVADLDKIESSIVTGYAPKDIQ